MTLHPKNILIIDDDEAVLAMLKTLFSSDGYNAATAITPELAMEQINSHVPDCILLDVKFPNGQDGYTFLKNLRGFKHDNAELEERVRKIAVLVLTGAGEALKPLFDAEGVIDYLQKPYDPHALKERVRQIINNLGMGL